MGTFATTTGLEILMPGITFDSITTSLAGKCISWSESWIKSCLSKRFDVSSSPFTVYTSTSQLTSIAEEMAVGHLHRLMSRGAKESLTRGDSMVKGAQDTCRLIASFGSDLMNADGTGAVANKSESQQVLHNQTTYHSTFDEDNPVNWVIDPDKEIDIEDGRL